MGALYRYDEFDRAFVNARVAEFRDQVARRLKGEITEDEFKSLRLMNGVYLQLHAYMLRIAIPYGTLSSAQLRQLAMIGRRWDRNYGHFTTRQNLQFNWIALKDVPDVLQALADVEMHAIQTSGNCMRNVTADHFAGAAADEVADPRVYAEIMRQWSTAHPELSYLPRKFKVAITGAAEDRAAIQVHDIGYQLVRDTAGAIGFRVFVGGGQGRTPMIGKAVREFLPEADLLTYTEAIMRVYNLEGRRDNKYKARIKILVHEKGFETIRDEIEREFEAIRDGALTLTPESVAAMARYFVAGPLEPQQPLDPVRPREGQRCGVRELGRRQRSFAQGSRLWHRDDFAEAGRRYPRRRDVRSDGPRRRPRRPLFAGRDPRQPPSEPHPAACPAGRPTLASRGAGNGRARHRQ